MEDSIDINPFLLPCLPFKDKRDLPGISAIYFVIEEGRGILYRGSTIHLKNRWNTHNLLLKIRALEEVVMAYMCCPIQDLKRIERTMIHHFQPVLNKDGVQKRPSRTKEQSRTKILGLRLDDTEQQQLDWLCVHTRRTATDLLRLMIRLAQPTDFPQLTFSPGSHPEAPKP